MNAKKIVSFKYLLNRNYSADNVTRNNLFRRTKRSGIITAMNGDIFDMEKEKAEFIKSLPDIIDVQLSQCRFNEIREVTDRMKLIPREAYTYSKIYTYNKTVTGPILYIEDILKIIFGGHSITDTEAENILKENLNGGKLFRGISTVLAYKYIEAPENITRETLRVAHALGWCTEMLQAYFLILDDIMDNSTTRRNKPCWYLRTDTGLGLSINDSIFLYSFLVEILNNNVGKSQNYPHFLNIFNETLLYSSVGQYLDIVTSQRSKDYSLFTIQRHNDIIKYKTAHYTFKLPVTLGILLADQMQEETREIVEKISLDLGKMFQIQDDYIDCFGDESKTGKIGTDIQEGKCSWLAVKALELCNNKQLTVFTACYGSKEPAHVERVKQLYRELRLPLFYEEEEKAIYNNLVNNIQTVNIDGVRKIFLKLLDLTFKRKK